MDPSRNMGAYRRLFEAASPPLVPFFPLLMKDISFIYIGNKSKIDGLVNFEKLEMLAKEISDVCESFVCSGTGPSWAENECRLQECFHHPWLMS